MVLLTKNVWSEKIFLWQQTLENGGNHRSNVYMHFSNICPNFQYNSSFCCTSFPLFLFLSNRFSCTSILINFECILYIRWKKKWTQLKIMFDYIDFFHEHRGCINLLSTFLWIDCKQRLRAIRSSLVNYLAFSFSKFNTNKTEQIASSFSVCFRFFFIPNIYQNDIVYICSSGRWVQWRFQTERNCLL